MACPKFPKRDISAKGPGVKYIADTYMHRASFLCIYKT
jgi:hypothetical protein